MQQKESEVNFENLKTNGIKVNYYLICQRKLWLYDKRISMENTSDVVTKGKILHETSYMDKPSKEIMIDDLISIDIIDGDTIREIKSSDKMKDADRIQILYYLFYLKNLGINKKGTINYPQSRKREFIELTNESEKEIIIILESIKKILSMSKPPSKIDKPYCKKCAYFEFCYS
jgi:CRISPR-associated exonuclease Cas4